MESRAITQAVEKKRGEIMEHKNYKMIEYYYKNYGKKGQELKSQKEYTDKNYIIECLSYAIMENQEITMVYSKSGNKDLRAYNTIKIKDDEITIIRHFLLDLL